MEGMAVKMLLSANAEAPRQSVPVILVVEDNPVERALITRILSLAELIVIGVDCGQAAIQEAITAEPDLILLDALLPDIDGFDVCAQLQNHARSRFIPIVMLTGLDDVASIDRAYEAGATDFITKPINHALLVHRIRYLLRASSLFEELRLSRKSLATAQRIAKLGHWEFNIDKNRLSISDELCQLYRIDSAFNENSFHWLLDVIHPDDCSAVEQAINSAIQRGESGRVEHRVQFSDGSERIMEMHLAVVPDEDGSRHLLGISIDISARKESEREVLRLAYFDRLTTLPNRSLLELILDQEIPRAHLAGRSIALICIDLDLFSRVNNAMGYGAGDAVLRQVATRLARLVDAPSSHAMLERLSLTIDVSGDIHNGLAARLGADTFALLIAGDSVRQAAHKLAQVVREQFQQAFLYRGQEMFVSASIGFSCSDAANCPAEVLLQQADMALREAKREARADVREYHGELVAQVSTQMSIQSDMRKALLRGEFMVFYQPKVALRDGAITGFEALIRWQHPTRGQVSPVDFIHVAEETGQIIEIGRWVLQAACYQFRQWLERGLVTGRIAVNISACQFREPNIKDRVLTALAQSGLAPQHLELEITEGVLMSDPRAHALIEELRGHGISIALDDFGTGYSSLSYLTRFPIDTLKIDRCFVSNITYESEQAAIVTAVSSLSHRLNMKVIAEGVELESELQIITDLGCDEVQGYLVCKPLSAVDMERWLKKYALERQAGSAT
jgi:predicted signal transduction protein with EAL and GGDEF domain/DNA-binding response OmpR family regulator